MKTKTKTGMTLLETLIYSSLLSILLAGFIKFSFDSGLKGTELFYSVIEEYDMTYHE